MNQSTAIATETTICDLSMCDQYQQEHQHFADMEPMHLIALEQVTLSHFADEDVWRLDVNDAADGYTEAEAAQLIRDLTTALPLLRDLNAKASRTN